MKTVREIMSPVVHCVRDTSFLPEVAKSFRERSISGAPVVDKNGEYVGIISQSDISARVAKGVDDGISVQEILEGGICPSIDSIMVKDVMTSHLLKISVNADLKELGQALLIAGVHRLLVVEEGAVIGLVSTTDLIHGFLEPEKSSVEHIKRPERRPYLFETELHYDDGLAKVVSSFGNEFVLEPPPEFGGSGQHSSPEDLFVASINACLCLTFAEYTKIRNLSILSYDCRAIGRLEGDGVSQRFTRIDLYPKIKTNGEVKTVERLLEQAKLRCLVGRSADVIVVLHAKIEVEDFQEV